MEASCFYPKPLIPAAGMFLPPPRHLPQLPAGVFIRHLAPPWPSKWSVEGCTASISCWGGDTRWGWERAGERGELLVGAWGAVTGSPDPQR